MRDWKPEESLQALTAEAQAFGLTNPDGSIDAVAMGRKQLAECLNTCLAGMAHLASFGESESVRFQAQKYLIDRSMGIVSALGDLHDGDTNPLEKLLGEIVEYENAHGGL